MDVGCGSGYLGKAIGIHCNQYVGLDLSSENVRNAKKSIYKKGQYIMGDALHLPIRCEVSDCTLCSEVLGHIPNFQKGIEELSEVMKKHGKLIATNPNYFNPSIFYRLHIKKRVTKQLYDEPIPHP